MSTIAGATALVMALFFVAAQTEALTSRPHLAIALMAVLAFGNSLAHIALTGEAKQTSNVALAVIGCGLLFYSRRWLIAVVSAGLAIWVWIALSWPPETDLSHEAFVLVAASVLAALTYLTRMRNLESIATMKRAARDASLEAERRRLQKSESLRVLAGGVAHDLNNLLVGVLGNAELARGAIAPSSDAVPYLAALSEAGQRASELARQMLYYTGRSRLATEAVSWPQLAADVGRTLKKAGRASVPVELELTGDVPVIDGDSAQLQLVILNLIDNALDAIGDQPGRVTVVIDRHEVTVGGPANCVQGGKTSPGRYARMRVTDTGSGIDSTTLERMFDPFYTTKNTGRGLGLSAVSGIVRAHHGTIQVESRQDQGTCVTVLLPARSAPMVELGPTAEVESSPRAKGATVLIADDEAAVRWVAREALRSAGFRVIDVKNGLEALQILHRNPEGIDLAVLDCNMPMMKASQVLRTADAPGVSIILTSGFEEEAALGAYENVVGFLQKPFNASEVVAAVERALNE